MALITENFMYSQFEISRELASKIKKGWTHSFEGGFHCPLVANKKRERDKKSKIKNKVTKAKKD